MFTKTLGLSINPPSMSTIQILFPHEKAQAKRFGIASAALLAIVSVSPWSILTALLALALAATVWKTVFHGSTAISMCLRGTRRIVFQVTVSIVLPLILAFYFIIDTPVVTVWGLVGHMLSPWYLIPIVLIAYFGWWGTDLLDKEQPFRGFIVATTVLFVICVLGYHGIYSEVDYANDDRYTGIDKEAAAEAVRSGRYFGQFLFYVCVSYVAMLAKLSKRHS